jgi:two-component system, OmpR family, sensor kinase
MIRSLRGRLFVGLTCIIILTGAIGGRFAYDWAFQEAIEMQDGILIQLASLAQNGAFGNGQPLDGVEENTEVWIIELGKTPHGPPDDRSLFALQDGLQVTTWKKTPIRVLLRTRADGSRFAVAQPIAFRDESASDMALRTLLPIAALIPCLMLVTALVISHSLRPVIRLAGDLDKRRADDLTPLPLARTPSELHPFITSINALLARLKLMMDQQRRFIADAAHELRTPVTALSLQAENLDSVALPEAARARVDALKQGMQRTKHLLEQLLALARHEAQGAKEGAKGESWSAAMPPIALDRAAKEVVAELLPLALDRRIDLGFELVEALTVRAEPVMLAAVIRNLLDNALRFTPEGGRVDVGVYRQTSATDEVAVLQVEDTGPGIAAADLDRIFEPFFRGSDPKAEGTGLGLSIVKRILDGLGGAIALETITGNGQSGLRVTVRLPLAAVSEEDTAAAPSS